MNLWTAVFLGSIVFSLSGYAWEKGKGPEFKDWQRVILVDDWSDGGKISDDFPKEFRPRKKHQPYISFMIPGSWVINPSNVHFKTIKEETRNGVKETSVLFFEEVVNDSECYQPIIWTYPNLHCVRFVGKQDRIWTEYKRNLAERMLLDWEVDRWNLERIQGGPDKWEVKRIENGGHLYDSEVSIEKKVTRFQPHGYLRSVVLMDREHPPARMFVVHYGEANWEKFKNDGPTKDKSGWKYEETFNKIISTMEFYYPEDSIKPTSKEDNKGKASKMPSKK